ncbi:MAG: hypothetical protein HW406_2672 [Candidatus Brocadiaceae bacterium]|nr:hypothetical protein [Candidatus Brocadiaceae bacterium]
MIKVLLLGIGRWGSNHLRVLSSLPVELFVSDIHKDHLSAALTIGIPATHLSTNPLKFVSRVDAAVVVTPAQSHFDLCQKFLEALNRYDCVCGTRVEKRGKGDNFIRIISSRIANWVRNKLSDENVSDAGCTYRAFKRECLARIKFFKGAHRFLPTLIKMKGVSVTEIPVT